MSSFSDESLDALLIESANGLDQEKIEDRPEALADLIGRKALGC